MRVLVLERNGTREASEILLSSIVPHALACLKRRTFLSFFRNPCGIRSFASASTSVVAGAKYNNNRRKNVESSPSFSLFLSVPSLITNCDSESGALKEPRSESARAVDNNRNVEGQETRASTRPSLLPALDITSSANKRRGPTSARGERSGRRRGGEERG